jgi:hypothetical protein
MLSSELALKPSTRSRDVATAWDPPPKMEVRRAALPPPFMRPARFPIIELVSSFGRTFMMSASPPAVDAFRASAVVMSGPTTPIPLETRSGWSPTALPMSWVTEDEST